jgi:hypothetical protein
VRLNDFLAEEPPGDASREFMRITFTDVPAAERAQVRRQLEAYCTQDTQALIDILFALH